MKLVARVSLLLLSVAFAGGCGPSQADYDNAKRQFQLVSTERDNAKSQLEQANAKIQSLQQQVTTLQTAATAKTEAAAEAKAPAKGKAATKGSAKSKKKHGRTAKKR